MRSSRIPSADEAKTEHAVASRSIEGHGRTAAAADSTSSFGTSDNHWITKRDASSEHGVSARDPFTERLAQALRPNHVWVRAACIARGVKGPYHWTEACVIGTSLVAIDRAVAEASPNLRPCKRCEDGGKNVQPHHTIA